MDISSWQMGQGCVKLPSLVPSLISLFLHICYNHMLIIGFWFSDRYFIVPDVMRENVLFVKALLGAWEQQIPMSTYRRILPLIPSS